MKAGTKEEFIKAITEGITAPPQYFPINAKINKEGYESLDAVLKQGLKSLSVDEFKKLMSENVIILDTRNGEKFTQGFLPGSINIGLDGRFAEWAGSLLPFDRSILLVTEPGKEEETIVRLARVGFNKMSGYLQGGVDSWKNAGEENDMIIDIEPDELLMDMPHDKNLIVLDVRKPAEFADGHLKNAINIPLDELTDPGNLSNFEEHHNLYVHCAGGYRSVIAASMLKRHGIHNLRNVVGGWNQIKTLQKVQVIKEVTALN